MALYKFIEDDDVQIAVWQIAETEQELTSLVGIDYSKSYASTHRRLERLATRALLNHLGYNETIEYQESGKPYLLNRKVDISISHAGEFVAVGLCKTRSIGVDIENINRKYTAVTSKYLSTSETAWINKNDQRSLALDLVS